MHEAPHISIDGKYRDLVIGPNGQARDYGWRSNVIVDRCRQLLAAFMKGDPVTGIQFIALGRGDPAWDLEMPEAPNPSTDSLQDTAPETIAISDASMEIAYLDSVGAVSPDTSHRIQVSLSIAPGTLPIAAGETAFPLREFALFGQLGPDDYMIDYVRHPVMNVGPADTLIRRIRLIF
jgi:hypothetical protein